MVQLLLKKDKKIGTKLKNIYNKIKLLEIRVFYFQKFWQYDIIHTVKGEIMEKITPASYEAKNKFMQEAINEAREGIFNQEGGPFGSVIVKDGKIVGRGHNRVVKNNDPTCHGEVSAIRNACENLGTFDLSGCEIYTTGEPCQMCLTACLWANLDKVYYGCTIEDNSVIGFRDEKFDNIFSGREKLGDFLEEVDRDACLQLFEEYKTLDKTMY